MDNEERICKKSKDNKHRYRFAQQQHAVTNHACYECVFCQHPKCVSVFEYKDPYMLPTDEDFDDG